ncbi:MAG: hypothetical protein IT449_05005 [Phycisphaerales bacterium]|nr:hypothetical protein [Phycisphaerales bacterium]
MNRRTYVFSRLPVALTALAISCAPGGLPGGNDNSSGANDNSVGGGNGNLNDAPPDADAMPDFSLVDLNPESPRRGEAISPRDYLGEVSAWYFGHAT